MNPDEELMKQIDEKREGGMNARDACRAVGVNPPRYYGWKGSRNRKVKHTTIMVEETSKQSKEKIERAKLLIGLALEELNRL